MKKIAPLLGFVFLLPLALGDLKVGFYNSACPRAESIVRQVVQSRFQADRSVTAALLRMHFHDCFVRGCDASILIDSTDNNPSEKSAGPNLTVRGFEIIDEAKKNVEDACPSTVSCADIITLATRDAVFFAGGPSYDVATGRRDGITSAHDEVSLPGPTFSVPQAQQAFAAKGFTLTEMVTLLGGHTVGVAHCSFFKDRLSDFRGTGAPDPSMDPSLAVKLNVTCGASSSGDPTVSLDQSTSSIVDNKFYSEILAKRGILQIDQELAVDKSSVPIVAKFASDANGFRQSFANAMVKMGNVGVLTGNAGEIRKNCRVFN
ncbi:peroxidase 44-like [Rhodamnia argentea]|uniref:Peroxidase n=1 Tax=Rhodamnia argentea TaxID=178133 RepID=A0A8B8NC34_9MYRT|nr:peroxidase 44-like [Rhodamnia argentea]